MTALPVSLMVIAVAGRLGIIGTESRTLLEHLLPGGWGGELVVEAWYGGATLADSLPLLTVILAWVVVATALTALTARPLRPEPRR